METEILHNYGNGDSVVNNDTERRNHANLTYEF